MLLNVRGSDDQLPANRPLVLGVLVVVLRRQRLVSIAAGFMPTTGTAINARKRRRAAGVVNTIEGRLVSLNEDCRILVASQWSLSFLLALKESLDRSAGFTKIYESSLTPPR